MRHLVPVLILCVPLAGCSDTASLQAPERIPASVSVTLAKTTLAIGESTIATATVKDDYNNVMTGIPVTWSSSSPTTASVSENGVVSAVLSGVVTITANAGGRKGAATLAVVRPGPAPIASVELSINNGALDTLGTIRAQAVVRDVTGAIVQRSLQWLSTAPAVASVDGAGWVTARAGGNALITVSIEGKADTVAVTVPPIAEILVSGVTRAMVGRTYTLTAVTRLATGRAVTRPVRWESLDDTRARVTQTGQLTALVAGPVHVRVTSEGISAELAADAIGWVAQQTATGFQASIESEAPIYGTSGDAYPTLTVGCEAGAPFLRIGLPVASTGLVTDPYDYNYDYYYYGYRYVQWNATSDGVTMPPVSTAEFKALMTNMTIQSSFTTNIQLTDGTWRYVTFGTTGVRAAVAPAAAACPAFAP